MSRLLKVNDVATLTALSPLTIRRMIASGRLPCVRPAPRSVRVPASAVAALVAGSRTTARDSA